MISNDKNYFLNTNILQKSVDSFREKHPELFKEKHEEGCLNRYNFDWLNLNSYLYNWNSLTPEMKLTINDLIDSDLTTNCFRQGVKQPDYFEKHLLLLTGSEIWDIKSGRKTNMVLSTLKMCMFYCKFVCFGRSACGPGRGPPGIKIYLVPIGAISRPYQQ
jgi:hypothetical protein